MKIIFLLIKKYIYILYNLKFVIYFRYFQIKQLEYIKRHHQRINQNKIALENP